MIRLLRAELLKLRTIWSTWVVLGITMFLTGGIGVLTALAPHHRGVEELLYPPADRLDGSTSCFPR